MRIDLNQIEVYPVFDYFERADIESVLSRCHPLGTKKAIGRRLAYAAHIDDEWVAVLLFDTAVDRNKYRAAEIGWTPNIEVKNREYIACNSRFAILPLYQNVPNLASKVLGLVAARISEDWKQHYKIPLLALETYVDPDHNQNQGTCYEAAGWKNLGISSGYEKKNGERTHGKYYLFKTLHPDSYAALASELPHPLITGAKEVSGKSSNNYTLDLSRIDWKSLQRALKEVPDPRRRSGVYKFVPLLSLCVIAVLCGYTQYRQIADWISKLSPEQLMRFGLPGHRTPNERSIGKFLSRIDSEKLHHVLTSWLLKEFPENRKVKAIQIDGKALRGYSSQVKERKSLLNVYADGLGIVLQQVPTVGLDERAAAKEAIAQDAHGLLEGSVVVGDALHTDQGLARALKKKAPRMSSLSKAIRRL